MSTGTREFTGPSAGRPRSKPWPQPMEGRLQLGEGSPGHFARELLPRSVLTHVDVVAARQRDQLLGVPDREHLRDPSREHRLQ